MVDVKKWWVRSDTHRGGQLHGNICIKNKFEHENAILIFVVACLTTDWINIKKIEYYLFVFVTDLSQWLLSGRGRAGKKSVYSSFVAV